MVSVAGALTTTGGGGDGGVDTRVAEALCPAGVDSQLTSGGGCAHAAASQQAADFTRQGHP